MKTWLPRCRGEVDKQWTKGLDTDKMDFEPFKFQATTKNRHIGYEYF